MQSKQIKLYVRILKFANFVTTASAFDSILEKLGKNWESYFYVKAFYLSKVVSLRFKVILSVLQNDQKASYL